MNAANQLHATSAPELTLIQLKGAADLAALRELFLEYATSLAGHVCLASFRETELLHLPEPYVGPVGGLWLARVRGEPAGCVALRPQSANSAEVKRLYVRPQFRGQRIGSELLAKLIRHARQQGVARLTLETMADMVAAGRIYAATGFKVVRTGEPNTPIAMELELGGGRNISRPAR